VDTSEHIIALSFVCILTFPRPTHLRLQLPTDDAISHFISPRPLRTHTLDIRARDNPDRGPKQGELNPFVPGSQAKANAIASGLLAQTTPLQQLQIQQRRQQQAHAQQQHQTQQNHQRAMMEMHRALSGGLGTGVGGGLGGGLMNTSGVNNGLGLGPLGMGGGMGSAGVAGGSNGLGVGRFRNAGGGLGQGTGFGGGLDGG
jgi:hypothetical protein